MPRAPRYQSQVDQRVNVVGPRFQAVDNGGGSLGGIAAGLQGLGQAGAQFAEAEDQRQAAHDDTFSRSIALEGKREIDALKIEFSQLQGENAPMSAEAYAKRLKEVRDKYMEKASNKRMREMLSERLDPYVGEVETGMMTHTAKQYTTFRIGTIEGEIANAQEEAAANFTNPRLMDEHISEVRRAARELGSLQGVGEDEIKASQRKLVSGVHRSVVTSMLSQVNPDVELASAYFAANEEHMTSADRNAMFAALQAPLQLHEDTNDFYALVSGEAASPGGGSRPAAAGDRGLPVAGGQVTDDFAAHRARGSAGVDYAAPAGSAILPAAEGEVVERGYDERSGHYIIVRHTDGHTTSYSHMKQPSPIQQGQRVTRSTVIGSVGSTGKSSGNHLHLRVRDPQGRDVDPEEYLAGASVTGSVDQPRQWDIGALMSDIDAKEASGQYSLEKAERMRQLVQKRVNQDEWAMSQQFRAADREAMSWFIENQGFTDVSAMPAEIRDRLSPEAFIRWQGLGQSNARGESIKPNGETAVFLQRLAIQSPAQFAGMDLSPYMASLTPAERESIILSQDKTAKNLGEWSPNTKVVSIYNQMAKMDQANHGDAGSVAVQQLMIDEIHKWRDTNGGKEPTDLQYREAYRNATKEVRSRKTFLPGVFGENITFRTSNERFRIEGEVEDASLRNEARDRLRVNGINDPSAEELEIMTEAIRKQRQ